MAAPKGTKPPGGSRKGVPNKVTKELKDMILGALDKAGGVAYLVRQAKENPTAFLTLVGKVLPLQVNADINGQVAVYSAQPLTAEEWEQQYKPPALQ